MIHCLNRNFFFKASTGLTYNLVGSKKTSINGRLSKFDAKSMPDSLINLRTKLYPFE